MAVDMDTLADDLAAETLVLRGLVADLKDADWRRETPAVGWTIADQLAHLAFFDDAAVSAVIEPDEFRTELARIQAAGGVNPDAIADDYRAMPASDVLAWFDESRTRLITTFRDVDPSVRLPWFGPPMSAATALTARIMETWAHGQDIADSRGVVREATDRLRHVAHIGVGARAFSFETNGRPVPETPVRVELRAPTGGEWSWGPSDADNRVTGAALDFCLVVTQRRNLADVSLTVTGADAAAWMEIAQAFAGPPGEGRPPRRE
jgi:uncharacterized protein (TIGR03084 family)